VRGFSYLLLKHFATIVPEVFRYSTQLCIRRLQSSFVLILVSEEDFQLAQVLSKNIEEVVRLFGEKEEAHSTCNSKLKIWSKAKEGNDARRGRVGRGFIYPLLTSQTSYTHSTALFKACQHTPTLRH
jgi:hypothetical protein